MRLPLILALIGFAATAHAGRSRFGWLYDTETLPVRTVEIEGWVQEEDGKAGVDETLVWLGPVIGLSDHVELALPVEVTLTETMTTSTTQIERYGAEVRWRLNDPDPVEAGPFGALLRFAAKRVAVEHAKLRFEGDAVVSWDGGPVRLAVDLGTTIEATRHDSSLEIKPALGASVRAWGELRLGAEFVAELHPGTTDEVSWEAVGPNLSFAHGRSWLSASFLVGIHNIDYVPRLNWAVQF
jgi:hypothetical protein